MSDDPIIQEVRKAGKKLEDKFYSDLNRLTKYLKTQSENEEKHGRKIYRQKPVSK